MSYNYFANLYDDLTNNVDYKVRSDYISGFFNDYGVNENSKILDMACGTCSISLELVKKGYIVTGVDASQEMLQIASNKAFNNNANVSLICAKMQEYRAINEYDGCICTLDSINHLDNENDVAKTFDNIYNSLKNNGIFVFDVNTIYKHNSILADNTFVFEDDNYYLVWDNEQLSENKIRILLDMFIYNGSSYDRYSEEFVEKAYSIDFLKNMLIDTGFSVLGVFDELTKDNLREDSQRAYFVCKKVI